MQQIEHKVKLIHTDEFTMEEFMVSKKNAINGKQSFELKKPAQIIFMVFRDTDSKNELFIYRVKGTDIFVWSNKSQEDAFRRLKGHLFEKFTDLKKTAKTKKEVKDETK